MDTKQDSSEFAKRFQLILDSTDEGIYGIDLTENCIFVNKSGLRMLGYAEEELIGRKLHSIIHCKKPNGDIYPASECPILHSFKTGKGIRDDSEVFWRKDGTAFYVEYAAYPIVDEGIAKGVVVSFTDITKRKIKEESLTQFRKAVESSGDAIFLTDINGIFTYVNSGFTKMYGYSSGELVGKNTPRVFKSGKLDRLAYEHLWKTILSKQEFKAELINKTKDGRIITIEGSINSVIGDNGNIIGFLGIQRDITQRKAEQNIINERTIELEKFSRLAVGRELKMVELKKKIQDLENELKNASKKNAAK
ncbi:MAG: PAS domain-containing protein [Nanoarchaeota archaeon]